VKDRDIKAQRERDAASAGLAMRQLACTAARAGDLVRAVAWARAAVKALAGDSVLRGEAEEHLARLIERQKREGGTAA
jgi:hypothetical protein